MTRKRTVGDFRIEWGVSGIDVHWQVRPGEWTQLAWFLTSADLAAWAQGSYRNELVQIAAEIRKERLS